MCFLYKNSQDDDCGFQTAKLYVSIENGNNFNDEKIIQFQSFFNNILYLNPSQVDSNTLCFFKNMDSNLHFEDFQKNLHKIVSFSTYDPLINFLLKTNEENVHYTVSWIISVLTENSEDALIELLNHNILKAIGVNIEYFKFPNSTVLLLNIIANYLLHQNDLIAQTAHKYFPMVMLLKIFQYLKEKLPIENDYQYISIEQIQLIKSVSNKIFNCIYTTLKKYSNEIRPIETEILIIEMAGYFDIILKDPKLCQSLCSIVLFLYDKKWINFNNFKLYNYPSFLCSISKIDNEEVAADSFILIGKLISINQYHETNFNDYFKIITNLNENVSPHLLSASLFVCKSFFDNNAVSNDAYQSLSSNINGLLQLYDRSNFTVKEKVIELLCSYLNHLLHFHVDVIKQFDSVIISITNCFFDFVESNDHFDKISPTLHSLFNIIQYLFSIQQINSKSVIQFISDFHSCIKNLFDSDDDLIRSEAEGFLNSLNTLQNKSN